MTTIAQIDNSVKDIIQWRRYFHANPELMYEVDNTAQAISEKLRDFGVDEVVKGIGRTGVVGIIKGRETSSGRVLGLRADMDALPIQEATGLPYASINKGIMHACGHDGHCAMLLGAARYLAETRNFNGVVALVFQPAEEGGAGARAMIDDGLMDRFGIQEIYGLHNRPGLPLGYLSTRPGPMMAAIDRFAINITGKGGHAAYPHTTIDATLVAGQIMVMLQSITSRNIDPLEAAVLSVTTVRAGDAFNIIPETAKLTGTVRTLSSSVRDIMERRIADSADWAARALGAKAVVEYERCYPVLVNHADKTKFIARVARDVTTDSKVDQNCKPVMGGEDFAFMLQVRPGAFIFAGLGEERALVHQPFYDFNDDLLTIGCSYWARLVELGLPIST